jgi:Pyruvate/2-oxoacid:ferredoxin oxidoreductase gamma subunit
VHVARGEVLSPACPQPHVLEAFNTESLEKFGPTVRAGGIVLYDSTVISRPPALDSGLTVLPVPFTQIATDLGKRMVKNVAALGALQAATELIPAESLLAVLRGALKADGGLLELNEAAFAAGARAASEARRSA